MNPGYCPSKAEVAVDEPQCSSEKPAKLEQHWRCEAPGVQTSSCYHIWKLCIPERHSAAAKLPMGRAHGHSCSQLLCTRHFGLQPLVPAIIWFFFKKVTKVNLCACVFYAIFSKFSQANSISYSISSENIYHFGWKQSRSELLKMDLFRQVFLLYTSASTSAQIIFSLPTHIKNQTKNL